MKLFLTDEDEFLINLLFKDKFTNDVDFELLTNLTSGHLLIPTFFKKLKGLKLMNKIPKDLAKYLQEIYELNELRNKKLKKVINQVSSILNKKKIEYVLIKGASFIANNQIDYGERMLGDIDILVKNIDFIFCADILKNNGFKVIDEKHELNYRRFHDVDTFFFNQKHYPRLIHPNYNICIEIHKKITYPETIDINSIFENKLKIGINYIPSYHHQKLISINTYKGNNIFLKKNNYDFKSLYDFYITNKVKKFTYEDSKINNRTKDFIIFSNELGITNFKIEKNLKDYIFIKTFNLNRKYTFLYNILNYTSSIAVIFKTRLSQFFKFFLNNNYRRYILKRFLMS